MAQAFNPSTWEAEIGGSLWVWGQPGLQSKFQDSQGYTEKPCLKKPIKKEKERERKRTTAGIRIKRGDKEKKTNKQVMYENTIIKYITVHVKDQIISIKSCYSEKWIIRVYISGMSLYIICCNKYKTKKYNMFPYNKSYLNSESPLASYILHFYPKIKFDT